MSGNVATATFDWVRVPEAAKLLGVSRTRVYELVKSKEIPHLEGPLRFDRADLVAWVTRQKESSTRALSANERPWYSCFRAPDPEKDSGNVVYRLALGPHLRTRREAERAEEALKDQITREALEARQARARSAAAAASADDPLRFGNYTTRWLAHLTGHRKPSTIRLYTRIVDGWLKPYFGDILLTEITAVQIDAYKGWAVTRRVGGDEEDEEDAGQVRSAKWINETLSCLSSMCTQAVKWRMLAANPCDQVERLRQDAPDFDFYTHEESEFWLATCEELRPDILPLFMTGFRAGLRLGELMALRPEDLDFRTSRIHVRRSLTRGRVNGADAYVETEPKSGKSRIVDMSPQLREVLQKARHDGDRVFLNREGRVWTREALRHPWEWITRVSKLRDITMHGMRHSFASQLVMAGAHLSYVQAQLGHSTMRMTERYAHLAPGSGAEFVARLDSSSAGKV